MKARNHLILSSIVAAIAWVASRRMSVALSSMVSGVLIDLDHLVDYLREYGFDPDTNKFFDSFKHDRYRKIWIPLHSWELLIVLYIAARKTRWNSLVTGLFLGMLHHMIADQLTNKPHPLGYSLVRRAWTGFVYGRSFIR